jgi:hypothetical protein
LRTQALASNNGMHPTRDTTACMYINLEGGRVMPGVGQLSAESDTPTEKPLELEHPFENIRESMIERESESAFIPRRILHILAICAAGLLISCQNNS